ncbi:MAG TPA: CBS domain-containing protein [Desulfomonilaceae bacterium]|nr:CBS domain-containing protein [Desulfomonilaceae bacterium]
MTARIDACVAVDISDDDIFDAMKDVSGYLDITPGDFKEVYLKAYRHAVTRLTQSVKAADVMTRQVVSVGEATPLQEVARLMADRKISGVPVVDDAGKVLGIISEKDFLAVMGPGSADTFMCVVAQCLLGKGCLAAPYRAKNARDIMTSPAVTVTEGTPIMDVASLFSEKKINRAPVVDKKGVMIGIVSRADALRWSLVPEDR